MKTILSVILLSAMCAFGQNANVITFNVGQIVKQEPIVQGDPLNLSQSLEMPAAGYHQLNIISTNTVELFRVTQKPLAPLPYTGEWTFFNTNGDGTMPNANDFVVWTNGVLASVVDVDFKRRVLYASLQIRDMRLGNYLYLTLAGGLPTNCVVVVSNVSGSLWTGYNYEATNSWTNLSPVIHVNQTAYLPGQPKKAYVGYYLGTGGELTSFATNVFHLLNVSNQSVFSAGMTHSLDVGFSYESTPYQKVFEMDFSAFNTEGHYRIFVPGLGVSYPFWIDDAGAANMARTYALGIYHQRCGTTNDLPHSRYTHAVCHTNYAYIPTAPGNTAMSNSVNAIMLGEGAGHEDQNGGLEYIGEVLYPYVSQSRFDSSGGHHDAGDYSKYTTSVAKLIEALFFAVDSMPGVKHIDNIGIPESGDGISDILQEAKWESDYLAKIQDSDGGFYMLCYPTNGQYQNNLPESPENSQLMMPKSTVATAAAVGALAQAASSPTFKAAYPAAAATYLSKALAGWTFLTNAFTAHGFDDSYQYIMFQGAVFNHTDEVYYASTALYLATTNTYFSNYARALCPTPNHVDNRRWGLIAAYEGYGYAMRQWAFAVSSGRVLAAKVDSAYVDSCKDELRKAAADNKLYSDHTVYGSSIFDDWKSQRQGGWYFGSDMAFDSAVAHILDGDADDMDVILKNLNYELGANPVNVSYVTGAGWRRQRETVNSYSVFGRSSHHRDFPPTGIPLGNYQSGYDCCYDNLPDRLEIDYPKNDATTDPYAFYDRWGDTFNVTTEWVVSQAARSLATAAYLASVMGQTNQAWNSQPALIVLSTNIVALGSSATCYMTNTGGISLATAQIMWEAVGQSPSIGLTRTLTPTNAGSIRVEAEAVLPDGRRLFARTNFTASEVVTNNIDSASHSNNAAVVAWYKLDSTLVDNEGNSADATKLTGDETFDTTSFIWTNRPQAGGAIAVNWHTNGITASIANADVKAGSLISIKAWLYIRAYRAPGQGPAKLLQIESGGSHELNMYQNSPDTHPTVAGGGSVVMNESEVGAVLQFGKWQQWEIILNATGYTVKVDGVTVKTLADAADYAAWPNTGNCTIRVGGYYGWIDEIVIKNAP